MSDLGVDPSARRSEPEGCSVTDFSLKRKTPTRGTSDGISATRGAAPSTGGGRSTGEKRRGAADGHGEEESGAEDGSGAAIKEGCKEEEGVDPLGLLGLPPGLASMVRRRAGLDDDGVHADGVGGEGGDRFVGSDIGGGGGRAGDDGVGNSSGGGGGGGGGGLGGGCARRANIGRNGEERVTLALEVHTGHGRHVLAGLSSDAVRLVKERIFSFARVAYARVYGLRGSAVVTAAAAAGDAGDGAAQTMDEGFAASWWDGVEQHAKTPSGTDGGEEMDKQSAQRGREEGGEENDGADDVSLVSGGKGGQRAMHTGDTDSHVHEEEEEETQDGWEKARKRARAHVACGSSGDGTSDRAANHNREDGRGQDRYEEEMEQSKRTVGKPRRAATGKAATAAAVVQESKILQQTKVEVDDDDKLNGGGHGRAYTEPDGTGSSLPEMSQTTRGPAPGSGALAELVREFVRTPAFLSWVHDLRRADGLSHGVSFSDGVCCDSDEWVEDLYAGERETAAVASAADDADDDGFTARGGGDGGGGDGGGRGRDPFVFFARFKDEVRVPPISGTACFRSSRRPLF